MPTVPHRVALYFDEGPGIGLGHRRRVEALAMALAEQGLVPELRAVDVGVVAPRDACSPAAMVIDSYRSRADDRTRYDADVVVAFDDLDRDLDVDLLILAAPGADSSRAATARRVRAGAEFVVVDPGLDPTGSRPIADGVVSILITTGAADADGVGAQIAADLRRRLPSDTSPGGPAIAIDLVVGRWGTSDVPAGVNAIVAPPHLRDHLAAADVVITAGGITMLEALRLGRPTIVVVTADNQRRQVGGVADAKAAWVSTRDCAAIRACSLIEDTAARAALAQAGRELIDGHGAERLALEIRRLVDRVSPAPDFGPAVGATR